MGLPLDFSPSWRVFGRASLVRTGLAAAYVVLFSLGTSLLGPPVSVDASDASSSMLALVMLLVMGIVDVALFGAWITRARAHGVRLWLQSVLVFYGIKTFSSQLEVWYFVDRSVVSSSMLPQLLLMTVPVSLGWTALAVWLLRGRPSRVALALDSPPPPVDAGLMLRGALAGIVVYPVLFFCAGYYVAWQSDELRQYYGGSNVALPVADHFVQLFGADPWVLPFEMLRGLLWVAIGWPVLRGTRGPWWVGGLLFASMLAVVQNDVHLLPNPLMPRLVRVWHLIETASSNFVFGCIAAALLVGTHGLSSTWQRPRPRPRPRFAVFATWLVGLLAVNGLVGGALLWFDPSGGLLGLPLDLLQGTPFSTYEIPGVVLCLANGVLPAIATVAAVRNSPWSSKWMIASGAVLLTWMLCQFAWIGGQFWLQPLLIAWSLALLGLGVAWDRMEHKIAVAPGNEGRTRESSTAAEQ